nr:unnamed protein product [Callosobruchus analis]
MPGLPTTTPLSLLLLMAMLLPCRGEPSTPLVVLSEMCHQQIAVDEVLANLRKAQLNVSLVAVEGKGTPYMFVDRRLVSSS